MKPDPNNTPDDVEIRGLKKLPKPSQRHPADQAREMGLKVGDIIIGREGGGDPETGWWQEVELTLRYLGEQCCVWKVARRSKIDPAFRDGEESSNWTLDCRD